LQYEYRRPDVEAALQTAGSVDALEAALRAALELMGDLGKPEVYGHSLYATGMDAALPSVAAKLGLADVAAGRADGGACIVVTQLYTQGGHSKVAYDISQLIGAEQTTVVMTDAYGRVNPLSLINARRAPSPLARRADLLLRAPNLVGKVLELYNILAALRPSRIFMLTHHFDVVAPIALWPFRDVVEFLHHADHLPSLGATLPWKAHVDLTWTCHRACRAAGLSPRYVGMTVRPDPVAPEPSAPKAPGAPFRVATCGPMAKYRGRASFGWVDLAAAVLGEPGTELLHIGPADEGFQAEMRQALERRGRDPARYRFTGAVPSLTAELRRSGVDAYLASFPASGGKANLEAMSLGLPTFVPVDPASAPLLQFDHPSGGWVRVSSPDELTTALRAAMGREGARAPAADVRQELEQFEAYVLGPQV
jgi:hypothetical protein